MGSLEGVVATRSLWAGSREVVHVLYDESSLAYDKLLAEAGKMKCTSAVYTYNRDQQAKAKAAGIATIIPWKDSLATRQVRKSEQKYYLRNTILKFLPLTELQAVKLNVAVAPSNQGKYEPLSYLSPRQIEMLKTIRKVLDNDANALAGFNFPEDQSQLIAYHQKLTKRLKELAK